MKALRRFWHRLVGSFTTRRRDAELTREVDAHLQLLADDLLRRGHSPAEARRLALIEFGGVEATKERYRDQRGLPSIDSLRQDVTFAWRSWRRSPGYTAVALLSLGIGLGVNTTVFGLLNGVLLKPLPVRNAQQLRLLKWVGGNPGVTLSGRLDENEAGETIADAFSADAFRLLRDRSPDLAEVMAISELPRLAVLAHAEAFSATGVLVSGNFFRGIGLTPRLGRALTPDDDRPGAPAVVVVSHRCWRDGLGADPTAVGRAITVNGHPFTVVGVVAENFRGVFGGSPTDLYVPLSAQPDVRPRTPWDSPQHWTLQLMARLRPDADERRAAATSATLFNAVVPQPATPTPGSQRAHRILLENGSLGFQYSVRQPVTLLFVLAASAGLVLLVACANIAGLQMVRGTARRHELAVRVALGAGRWRLVRQALTESLLLSLAGGGLGLLLAVWATTVLSRLIWPNETALDLGIDVRVFAFALALSVVAAMLAGLLPAVRTSRADPAISLAGRPRQHTPRVGAGRALVAVQIGLSLVLVVGAGLFTRTLINLYRVDTGFDPASVLVCSLDASTAGYKGAQAVDVYERVLASLARIPGVRSAAHSNFVMLSGWANLSITRIPEQPADQPPLQILGLSVSDGFFATMGLPVVRGRVFSPADHERSPRVVVVNEALARALYPSQDPLGKTLVTPGGRGEIVGVVRDMTYVTLREPPKPTVFSAYRQRPASVGRVHVEIRTSGNPLAVLPEVRKVLSAIDRRIPLADVRTQAQYLDLSIGRERTMAVLAGGLAAVAVLLSCLGLYGVMAYHVARRTGEIGLRMALGSTTRDIVGPIVRGAVLVVVAGVVLGLPAVLGANRLLREYLFGIEPTDAATIAAAILLLLAAAVAGALVPARRAARVDPVVALRCE